jgi:hypothetical protein
MVTGGGPGHSSAIVPPCAYRGGVSDRGRSGALSIAVYTAMRVGLFIGVWLLLQLLTPLRGLWAVAIAIVASGLISVFLLNRQRAAMSSVVGGFFGRINARIDAASQAEDEWGEQAEGQGHGIGDDEASGADEGRDEAGSDRAFHDDPQRADRPGGGE